MAFDRTPKPQTKGASSNGVAYYVGWGRPCGFQSDGPMGHALGLSPAQNGWLLLKKSRECVIWEPHMLNGQTVLGLERSKSTTFEFSQKRAVWSGLCPLSRAEFRQTQAVWKVTTTFGWIQSKQVQTEPAKKLTRQNDGRFSNFAADFHLNDDSPKWWTKTENVELG